MSLDLEWCRRARLARDARFDGQFFIAVITTHIYCRPICRARTSQEKNVRYFSTAAAAAEAGFRPCLRCRPESAPGTAAWAGTKTTVARALRLISEAGLEEGGMEALATHLGIGSRHLRRLFKRHLGANPRAVAHTRRLQFAKKLLDETAMPMTHIAIAAGFGSVRRFNAAIHDVYDRTPTQLRSRTPHRRSHAGSGKPFTFQLDYRPPYRWPEMLASLGAQALPGVEIVDAISYRRTVTVDDASGLMEVTHHDDRHSLDVRLHIEQFRSLFSIIERVRAIFDLNADWRTIERGLRGEPSLAGRLRARPGLRVAGAWSVFEIAVQSLLGAPASPDHEALRALIDRFGKPVTFDAGLTRLFPTPDVLARSDLRAAGLGDEQCRAVRALARAVRDRHIGFEVIGEPRAITRALAAMPGFTPGALEYIAMRALREPDAFPLRTEQVGRLLGIDDPLQIERLVNAWRPWRAYATEYLMTGVQRRGVN